MLGKGEEKREVKGESCNVGEFVIGGIAGGHRGGRHCHAQYSHRRVCLCLSLAYS